jgi:hypothetical protein
MLIALYVPLDTHDVTDATKMFAARYMPHRFFCVSIMFNMATLRTLKYCCELFIKPLKADNA